MPGRCRPFVAPIAQSSSGYLPLDGGSAQPQSSTRLYKIGAMALAASGLVFGLTRIGGGNVDERTAKLTPEYYEQVGGIDQQLLYDPSWLLCPLQNFCVFIPRVSLLVSCYHVLWPFDRAITVLV